MADTREKLVRVSEAKAKLRALHAWFDGPVQTAQDKLAKKIIEKCIEEIDKLEPAQKWIPVTERLPEDEERLHFYDDGRMRCVTVLAYTEYDRIIPKNRLLVRPTGNEYLDKQVTNGWRWARGTEEVTHWMPLPEPPKGE